MHIYIFIQNIWYSLLVIPYIWIFFILAAFYTFKQTNQSHGPRGTNLFCFVLLCLFSVVMVQKTFE